MVNFDQSTLKRDRISRAILDTGVAVDTAHITHLFNLLATGLFHAAGDVDPRINLGHDNDIFGTGRNTERTTDAEFRIDLWEVIHHDNGIKRAAVPTLTQPCAAILAGRGASEGEFCCGATGKA